MTNKQIIIDGKECRYWFRLNPDDYRKCSLRGKNDNCDEIKDCFIKELLGKLSLKEQECEKLKEAMDGLLKIQYKLADTSNKYNQKLEKIREYCNKYPQNSIGFKKNILQIIDEVEE